MKNFSIAEINEVAKSGKLQEVFPQKIEILGVIKMDDMKIIDFGNLPTKQYLIERLQILPGNLTLLCATGCSGKTMLVQYIASCVSSGKQLFDTFPVMKGSVVHIDQEQSYDQTHKRYIRIANGLNINSIDVNRVNYNKRFDDPDLYLKDMEEGLITLCTNKVLCIIDSLKAVSFADENSSSIEVILKMFKRVAEKTKCSIICVHHKGKGKDAKQSGRGHSSIYDSCDVQLDLEVNNEIYELSCAKNREGKYFDGIKYQLSDEGTFYKSQNCTDKLVFSLLQDDIKSSKQSHREKIIEILMNQNNIKYNDLFELVKGDRTKFSTVLHAMIYVEEISETMGPRNSKLYSLTDKFKASGDWK